MEQQKMINIKEAAGLAGKSEKTVRRWLTGITKNETHKDRPRVLPSVEDEQELRDKKMKLVWSIEEKLIREHFLGDNQTVESAGLKKGGGGDSSEVAFLREQVEAMRTELNDERNHNREMQKEYNALQKEQNERQRESNVLMRDLHEKLQLGSGDTLGEESGSVDDADVVDAKVAKADSVKKKNLLRILKYGPAVRFNRERTAVEFYMAKGE